MKGTEYGACRGVAYYQIPSAAASMPCAARVYTNTIDARLIAVDAETGRPCSGFGINGIVDLREGMGDVHPGYYFPSSAPTLITGRLVLGG